MLESACFTKRQAENLSPLLAAGEAHMCVRAVLQPNWVSCVKQGGSVVCEPLWL